MKTPTALRFLSAATFPLMQDLDGSRQQSQENLGNSMG